MKKIVVALFLIPILYSNASAFQPRSGVWGNANESGSAYTFEIQNGVLLLGVYSYETGGHSVWYTNAGALTNAGHTFSATLDKLGNGQCISCVYAGRPILIGSDGVITVNFTSETSADVSLPGGRTTTIAPYNFGFGEPPTGLYGEWAFVYDIGSTTFAERFNFSTNLGPTSNGNGLAYDPGRFAACELQIVGSVAGTVLCVDLTSGGVVENQYAFRYGLDETYGGSWISPYASSYGYTVAMKGFRIKGSDGVAKIPTMNGGSMASDSKASQERSAQITAQFDSASTISAPDVTLQAAFGEITEALRAAVK